MSFSNDDHADIIEAFNSKSRYINSDLYTSGAIGRGLNFRLGYTKGVKHGTSSSLVDACIERVVLGI